MVLQNILQMRVDRLKKLVLSNQNNEYAVYPLFLNTALVIHQPKLNHYATKEHFCSQTHDLNDLYGVWSRFKLLNGPM